jgi:hypothetical protein
MSKIEEKGMVNKYIFTHIMREPRVGFKKLIGIGTACGEDEGLWSVNIRNIAYSFGDLGEMLSANTVAATTALTVFQEVANLLSGEEENIDSKYFRDLSIKLINETTDYKALGKI